MSFGEKIMRFLASRRRHKLWQRIVGGLGIVVVFVTTYMLILPAITMEKPTYCGIEEHSHTQECYLSCQENESAPPEYSCGDIGDNYIHTHNDDCYYNGELVCPLEERENHVHTEDCYTEEQRLICDIEESEGHTHDESCYEVRDELICSSDDPEHVHDDSCYEHIEELICGQEESEGHTHDDSCYETVRVYNCTAATAHIHDADCYDANNELICNLEEAEEHIHSDACMTRHENKDHKHTDACYSDTPLCGKQEHEHTDACYENPNAGGGGSGSSSDEEATETTTDDGNHGGFDDFVIDDVISGAVVGPELADLGASVKADEIESTPDKFDAENVKVYIFNGIYGDDGKPVVDNSMIFDPEDEAAFAERFPDYAKYTGATLHAKVLNVTGSKVDKPDTEIINNVKEAFGIETEGTDFYNTDGFLVTELYYEKDGTQLPLPAGAKVDLWLNVSGAAGERYLRAAALTDDGAKDIKSDMDSLSGDLDSRWYDMIRHFFFIAPDYAVKNNQYCFVSTKVFGGYVSSIGYNKENGTQAIIDGTPNALDKTDNEDGYDCSLDNKRVRTFDNIQYNLAFNLANRGLTTPSPVEKLKIKFSQAKDISQAVFNMSDMSWIEDWRIDYYNTTPDKLTDGDDLSNHLVAYETADGKFRPVNEDYDHKQYKDGYKYTPPEATITEGDKGDQPTSKLMDLEYWNKADNTGKDGWLKTDYNEMIRVYQKTAASTVSSYDSGIRYQVLTGYTTVNIPGTQNRTAGIRVLASANNDDIAPVFDAYFEGNPGNLSQEVNEATDNLMENIFQKPEPRNAALDTNTWGPNSTRDESGNNNNDDTGIVKVTAAPRYKFNIQANDNLSYRGHFNLVKGDERTKADSSTVTGRMVGYGITLTLVNDSDNKDIVPTTGAHNKTTKGIMGIELPTGDINLNFNVESAKKDTNNFSTLSLEPTQPIMRLSSAVNDTFFSEITLDEGGSVLSILSSNGEVDTDLSETESVDYADENTDNADEYEYDSDNNYIENYEDNSGDTAPIDEESNAFTLSDDDNSYFDALVSDDTEYLAGNVDSINDTVFDALFDEEFYDLMAAKDVGVHNKTESEESWDFSSYKPSTNDTINDGDTTYGLTIKGTGANYNKGGFMKFTDGNSLEIPIDEGASGLSIAFNEGNSRVITVKGETSRQITQSTDKIDINSSDISSKKVTITANKEVQITKITVTYTGGGTGGDTDDGKDGSHTAVDETAGTESWDFTTNMPSTDKTVEAGKTLNSGVTVGDTGATLTSSGIKLAEGGALSFPAQIITDKPKTTIEITCDTPGNISIEGAKYTDGKWVIDDVSLLSGNDITIKATGNVTITNISVTYTEAPIIGPTTGVEGINVLYANTNVDFAPIGSLSIDSEQEITASGLFTVNAKSGSTLATYTLSPNSEFTISNVGTFTLKGRTGDVAGYNISFKTPSNGKSAKLFAIGANNSSSSTTELKLHDTSNTKVYNEDKGFTGTSTEYQLVEFDSLSPNTDYKLDIGDIGTRLAGLILVNYTDEPTNPEIWVDDTTTPNPPVSEGNIVSANVLAVYRSSYPFTYTMNNGLDDSIVDVQYINHEFVSGIFETSISNSLSGNNISSKVTHSVSDFANSSFGGFISTNDVKGKTITINVPNKDGIVSSRLYLIASTTNNNKDTFSLMEVNTNKIHTPDNVEITKQGNVTTSGYGDLVFTGLKPGEKYTLTIASNASSTKFVGLILVNTKDPLDQSSWKYPEGYTGNGQYEEPSADNNNTATWTFTDGVPGVDMPLDSGTDLNGITYVSGGGTSTFMSNKSGIVLAAGDGLKIPVDTVTYTGGKLVVDKTDGTLTIAALLDDGYKFTSREIKDRYITFTAESAATIKGISIAYDKHAEGDNYGKYDSDIYTWSFDTDPPSNAEKAYLKNGDTLEGGITFTSSSTDDECASYFGKTSLFLAENDKITVPLPAYILSGTVTIGTTTRDIDGTEISNKKIEITGEAGGTSITTIALGSVKLDTPADIISADVYLVQEYNGNQNTVDTTIDGLTINTVYSDTRTSTSSVIHVKDKNGDANVFTGNGGLSGEPVITDPNGKGEIDFHLKHRMSFTADQSVTITVPSNVGSAKFYVFGKGDQNSEVLFTLTDITSSSKKYYNDAYIGFKSGSSLQTIEFTDLQPNHKYEFKSGSKICPNGFALIGYQNDSIDSSKWVSSQPQPEGTAENVRVYVYTPYSRSTSNDKFTSLSIPEYQVHYQSLSAAFGGLNIFNDTNSKLSGTGNSTKPTTIPDIGTIQTTKRNNKSIDDSDPDNKIGGYLTFTVPNTVDGVKSARLYVNNCVSSGPANRLMELKNSKEATQTLTIEGTDTYSGNNGKDIVFTDLEPGETYTLTFDTGNNNTRFGSIVLVLSDSEDTTNPWFDPNFKVTPETAEVYAFIPYSKAYADDAYKLAPVNQAIHTQYDPTVTADIDKALDIFSDYKYNDSAVHTMYSGDFKGTVSGYGSITATKESGKSSSDIKIAVPNANTAMQSATLYVIASSADSTSKTLTLNGSSSASKTQAYTIGAEPYKARILKYTDLEPGKTYTLTPSGDDSDEVRYVSLILVLSADAVNESYPDWGKTTLVDPPAEAKPQGNKETDLSHIPFLWDYDPNYQPDDRGTWGRNIDWDSDGWRTNSARNAGPYNYGWVNREGEKPNYSYPEDKVDTIYGTEEYEVHWGGDWYVDPAYRLDNKSAYTAMISNKGNTNTSSPENKQHVDGVNSYPVKISNYEFDFENNSKMWFPTNYGGHSMGSEDFKSKGFGSYKVAYSAGYFQTIVPFETSTTDSYTIKGTVREFTAESLSGTIVKQDANGNISSNMSKNKEYDVDYDQSNQNTVESQPSGSLNSIKYNSFMAKGATNINDKDITDATRNDPTKRDDTNNIVGQFLGDSSSTKGQDWDASASIGDHIDIWGGFQNNPKVDTFITAANLMQKFDNAVFTIDETDPAFKDGTFDETKLIGRTWESIESEAESDYGLDPDVNLLWGVNSTDYHSNPTTTLTSGNTFDALRTDAEDKFTWYDNYVDAKAAAIDGDSISAVMAEVRNIHITMGVYFGFRIPVVVNDDAKVGQVYATANRLETWAYVDGADVQPMEDFTWLRSADATSKGKTSIAANTPDKYGNYFAEPTDSSIADKSHYFSRGSNTTTTGKYYTKIPAGEETDKGEKSFSYLKKATSTKKGNEDTIVLTKYLDFINDHDQGTIGESQYNTYWQNRSGYKGDTYTDKDNKTQTITSIDTAWTNGMGLLITDYKSQVEIDVENDSNVVDGVPYYNMAHDEAPVYRIHNIKTFTNRFEGSTKYNGKNYAEAAKLRLKLDLTQLTNNTTANVGGVYISGAYKPVIKFRADKDGDGVPDVDEEGNPVYMDDTVELEFNESTPVIIPKGALGAKDAAKTYSITPKFTFSEAAGEDAFKNNRTITFVYTGVPHMTDLGEIFLTSDMSAAAEPNTLVTATATITGLNNGDIRNFAVYSKNKDTTQIGISATSGSDNQKYVHAVKQADLEKPGFNRFYTADSNTQINTELNDMIVYTLAYSNVRSSSELTALNCYDILGNVLGLGDNSTGTIDVDSVKVFASSADDRNKGVSYPAYEVYFTDVTNADSIRSVWGYAGTGASDEKPVLEIPGEGTGTITVGDKYSADGDSTGTNADKSIITFSGDEGKGHTAIYFKISPTASDIAVAQGKKLYIQIACRTVPNKKSGDAANAQSTLLTTGANAMDYSNVAQFIANPGTGIIPVVSGTARFAPVGRNISGVVWFDENGSGVRDAVEEIRPTATVALFRKEADGYKQVKTDILDNKLGNSEDPDNYTFTTGNANKTGGTYYFNNLPAGEYVVAFHIQSDKAIILSTHQPGNIQRNNTNDCVEVTKLPADDQEAFAGYEFVTKYNTDDIVPITLLDTDKVAENNSTNIQNETNWDLGYYEAGDPLPETGGFGSEGIKYAGLAIACGAALMLMYNYTSASRRGRTVRPSNREKATEGDGRNKTLR